MAVGDKIRVEFGRETFSVGNYQSFHLGPFAMETTVQPGETDDQAFDRAYRVLESHASSIFLAKRNGYAERVRAKQI